MLVRYLRGQRQSHHTVENCDVRNCFLTEVSKVHACDLASLCVFFGATFDHHFGGFGDGQKNVRTVECVKKRPRFSLTKTVFFASNFEAIPESNPIFGDVRQETFMAARLKPNLRMAESTLR